MNTGLPAEDSEPNRLWRFDGDGGINRSMPSEVFSYYRSFAYLHDRVVLELQAELAQLEACLMELDCKIDVDPEDDLQHEISKTLSVNSNEDRTGIDHVDERPSILHELESRLSHSNQYVSNFSDTMSRSSSETRLPGKLRSWFSNSGQRLMKRMGAGKRFDSATYLMGDSQDQYDTDSISTLFRRKRSCFDSTMFSARSLARHIGMRTAGATLLLFRIPVAIAVDNDPRTVPTPFLRDLAIFDIVLYILITPAVVGLWYVGRKSMEPSFVGMLLFAGLWTAAAQTDSLREIRTTTLQLWMTLAANYLIQDCVTADRRQQHVLMYIALSALFVVIGIALQLSSENSLVKCTPLAVAGAAVILSFVPKMSGVNDALPDRLRDEEEGGMMRHGEDEQLVSSGARFAHLDVSDLDSLRSDGDVVVART